MVRMKRENDACSVFFMVAMLVALVSSAAHSARTIDDQDGLSNQKNYYPPTPNHHGGSPPKHSSHSSPSCPTPSHGSGGGGHSTPKTPATPTTPSHGSDGSPHGYPSPSSGGSSSPTPSITVPSAPESYDPNVPPFHPGTCSYWISHPGKIVAVVGYLGNIGDIFGTACVFAIGGKNPTLHDAVANTSADGIGALLREGTAALLNSLSCKSFPLTSQQVRSAFAGAVGNDGAAAAQAAVFKLANEGQYKS